MKRLRSQWGERLRPEAGRSPGHNRVWPGRSRAVVFCPRRRLKCCPAPYRPAATEGNLRQASSSAVPSALMGRSQVVRQRILIPPFGGSIPPAPASEPSAPENPDEFGLAGALLHSAATHHCCTGCRSQWLSTSFAAKRSTTGADEPPPCLPIDLAARMFL